MSTPDPATTLRELVPDEYEPLTHAEEMLLESAESGEECDCDHEDDDQRVICPEFFRWLVFDPLARTYIHDAGVAIRNSLFLERLDLEAMRLHGRLMFKNSQFDEGLVLRDAQLDGVRISGGKVRSSTGADAIDASGARINVGVFLRGCSVSGGQVNFVSATLGSSLECDRSIFSNPNGKALNAYRAQITGSVFLRAGFEAEGEVSFVSAKLHADIDCRRATFKNPSGSALNAHGAYVNGSVFLGGGFNSVGQVNFSSAAMRSLGLHGGTLYGNTDLSGDINLALNLISARITQQLAFVYQRAAGGDHHAADIDGVVMLRHARIGQIFDCEAVWNSGRTPVALDGCTYSALGSHPDSYDTSFREKWLKSGERLPGAFAPQPYTQLASVMRAAGHEQEAKRILIAREQRRRVRMKKSLQLREQLWLFFINLTLRHGYKPMTMFWWLGLLCALGANVFERGFHNGDCQFEPTLPQVYNSWVTTADDPHGERRFPRESFKQLDTTLEGYPAFNPFIYSVDTLFPLVDLHQERYWLPRGPLRWYLWAHIALGWIGTTLFVTGFTGVVRRE